MLSPLPRCLFFAAVDSVEEDHNGDVLLLAYLLALLQQDLRARLQASQGVAAVVRRGLGGLRREEGRHAR